MDYENWLLDVEKELWFLLGTSPTEETEVETLEELYEQGYSPSAVVQRLYELNYEASEEEE